MRSFEPRDRAPGWSAGLSGVGLVVALSLAVVAAGWVLAVLVDLAMS